jgi:hypothetical protein
MLSQTRGAGTPCQLVVLQSQLKFFKTVTTPQEPVDQTTRRILINVVGDMLKEIPDFALTGLATKARITITASSCFERTKRENGTLEYAREICLGAHPPLSIRARVLDLETGETLEMKTLEECDTVGEYVFWRCLEIVLRTDPGEMREAYLVMVKEPAKARSVTKARAALKIVLDFVGKLSAAPIAKTFKSSASGMEKANQAWNLFKTLFDEDMKNVLFEVDKVHTTNTRVRGETVLTEEVVFKKLYMSCTDFETATDYGDHEIIRLIAELWMRKIGIPKVLRRVVTQTSYAPRKIYFTATGPLSKIGEPAPSHYGENVRFVVLVRGILMGDPVTKPVLHLLNIAIRKTATKIHDSDFYRRAGFTNAKDLAKETVRYARKVRKDARQPSGGRA